LLTICEMHTELGIASCILGLERPGQMDTSHHKTESHFAQNVSTRKPGAGECPAKKPKSSQPIIIPIVVQWQFSVPWLQGCALLGTFGYIVPRTMVSRRLFIAQRWHFKCSQPRSTIAAPSQLHRQWQHYLANVDDMTRPLRATNKQTITRSRTRWAGEKLRKNACSKHFPTHTLQSKIARKEIRGHLISNWLLSLSLAWHS